MTNGKRALLLAADLLFPNRCGCCGRLLRYDRNVCGRCEAELQTLTISPEEWLSRHRAETFPWDGLFAVFAYEKAAKNGVLAMKDGKRGFAAYAGALLAERIAAAVSPAELSCVTWVPVSRRRRRAQGYAHAEMLGRAAARALHVPVRGGLLTESDLTARQHDLNRAERAVFSERFLRRNADLHGQTVLLCDDVLTTGSTLMRCTGLLRESGAARVFAAVAACRLTQRGEDAPDAG